MNIKDLLKECKFIKVSFEETLAEYRRYHGPKNDWWEERNLQRANDKFGSWIKINIPLARIGQIVMPQYQHEGVNITPKEGQILIEAYKNFRENKEYFLEGNAQFCRRVETQKEIILKDGPRIIFLSEEPLYVGTSYSDLHGFKNQITHLDGFHRLFALMELIKENKYSEKYVTCYIAVHNE